MQMGFYMWQQRTEAQVKNRESDRSLFRLNDDEIRRMREEAKANADADNKAKEKVDKINTADSMIFTTEKQLKEFGDKLPAD